MIFFLIYKVKPDQWKQGSLLEGQVLSILVPNSAAVFNMHCADSILNSLVLYIRLICL